MVEDIFPSDSVLDADDGFFGSVRQYALTFGFRLDDVLGTDDAFSYSKTLNL
jgi:hypothetical protein